MIRIKFKKKNKAAFTLVEVILILIMASVGLMAIMSLALKSVAFHNIRKNMFNAIFLADEGLALISNIRDSNLIGGRDYNDWSQSGAYVNPLEHYKIDPMDFSLSAASIENSRLFQDEQGYYLHSSTSNPSVFSRLITISQMETASSTIESWVRWSGQGENYDFKLETVLYDLSL